AKRPFIALGMWIWTALFFPNAWMYGLGTVPRYNLIFALLAIFGYLMQKEKAPVKWGAIGTLVTVFFIWTSLSSIMGIGNPEKIIERWENLLKIVMLFYFVNLIMTKKLHVDFFLWCLVLSLGFYAVVEGLKYLSSGGAHGIAGFDGHVLGDRNELAVACVMLLPILFYLMLEYGKRYKLIRFGLLGTMGLTVMTIIGTQSRGGMIALVMLFGYMFVKSDRKVSLALISIVVVGVASHFISAEWAQRMDTIGAADKDESFMGRVVAWKISLIIAMHNPIFGGGFKAVEFLPVWQEMALEWDSYSFFPTGDVMPNTRIARAAHSFIFQLLGEHGFFGLAFYLMFVAVAFYKAGRFAKIARQHAETAWLATLGVMLQLSLFAFVLGAMALSFAYFDVTFAILAIIQVLDSRILPAELAVLRKRDDERFAAEDQSKRPTVAKR
ncbi:MAG: putative O-glycosylation ligase, exosortase A system-associated, partial [Burkholderiaceae bacterium]|nr:putative O-glycosylation ligase, exosortase A system-associated [Burkholderiaceae bacterium]MBY0239721.1 putative O-glycosylation ligase, exosortase A system-associated [Burkholderiaceae bacterium]